MVETNGKSTGENYDYIVVGAGSAGCVLADRLTEDPDCRVLLLEAGGWDRDPWIHIPLGWGKILQSRLHDWGYFGEPEPNVGGRAVECARGKVIGGSSSINAMAYVRGHRTDFDRWSASGLKGWSYADVLPYFRRQESWEGGADLYRGDSGPLTTRESRYDDPLVEAYIEAGLAAGHPRTPDYNGAEQEGFGRLQSTIRDGRRCSAAVAYLRPALGRKGLTVRVGTLVNRVCFRGNTATGVEYIAGGQKVTAHAEREIVLAAGTINTPQILMLSGIGDPAELRRHNIPLKAALPDVGKNLQDHLVAMAAYSRKGNGPFQHNMRLDRIAIALAKAQLFGRGFATDLPSGVMAFIKTEAGLSAPDTQLLFHAGPLAAAPYLPPFKSGFADGFSCRSVLLRPESRGHLALADANPATPIRIFWNFLATERDTAAIRQSFLAMRDVGRQAPMREFVDREIIPGDSKFSKAEIDAHIRATAITAHHPLGTCRMASGGDEEGVVDGDLRVKTLDRLRIVDASVIPGMIGGNINAAVTMIAEKASDLIRGRAVPPADQRFVSATLFSRAAK
jgi:4-pyridoxate dehydrogenase